MSMKSICQKYECNERTGILGDAVSGGWYPANFLFLEHQTMPEGELTKIRASYGLRTELLRICARQIDLGEYLLTWKGRGCNRRKKERFCNI
ncbi:MAG: hypothetical protein ACLUUO_14440 [Sellimonas intestinalis]